MLEVRGVDAETLAELAQRDGTPADLRQWRRLLCVGLPDKDDVTQPMLGAYSVRADALRFEPRFPWKAGLAYRAVLDQGETVAHFEFERPAALVNDAPRSLSIYPSSDHVPENLLRLYLEFSHPMRQGEALERIELLDEKGIPVVEPFLHIHPELWDPEGTRLTLLLDPGRIKRGVQPNLELGTALRSGREYTLHIDPEWTDVQDVSLGPGFDKTFRVDAPDRDSPDHRRWRILTSPRAGSTDALHVRFDEALDHGQLGNGISITAQGRGSHLAGTAWITAAESEWIFRPDLAWEPGAYTLRPSGQLEDPAGNNLELPFETRGVVLTRKADSENIAIGFSVR